MATLLSQIKELTAAVKSLETAVGILIERDEARQAEVAEIQAWINAQEVAPTP